MFRVVGALHRVKEVRLVMWSIFRPPHASEPVPRLGCGLEASGDIDVKALDPVFRVQTFSLDDSSLAFMRASAYILRCLIVVRRAVSALCSLSYGGPGASTISASRRLPARYSTGWNQRRHILYNTVTATEGRIIIVSVAGPPGLVSTSLGFGGAACLSHMLLVGGFFSRLGFRI